jgi:hypothetical protein
MDIGQVKNHIDNINELSEAIQDNYTQEAELRENCRDNRDRMSLAEDMEEQRDAIQSEIQKLKAVVRQFFEDLEMRDKYPVEYLDYLDTLTEDDIIDEYNSIDHD